jgi:hypothetical protein
MTTLRIRTVFIRRLGLILAVLAAGTATPVRAQVASAPQFEKDVLPLLTAHCMKCHGGAKPKAGLDLRTRAGLLEGGESGPALVPGKSSRSLVYEMIRKREMPPGKETKLTAQQIALVKAWIDAGAPALLPSPSVGVGTGVKGDGGKTVTEKDRHFWAFQKPMRPPVPQVRAVERVRTPIDAFILAKLESKSLTLSPDADRATLLRRVTFDLIGLPPSPEEVDAFLADTRPDAYERVVDRLLASPHYGERWGRHWLDAAGYSDSIGGDNDPGQLFVREGMWHYRDYVVRSLNEDRPFDRFLTEQLAGDEMDDWRSAPELTATMREHLVATGLLRTSVDHTWEDELNRPFERYQVLHDTIENLTSNLIGLTVACARCHDHKFDPIPQVEYYRLMAVLKPYYNPEQWIKPQYRHLDDVPAKEKEAFAHELAELERQTAAIRRPYEKKLFEARLARVPEVIRADTAAALATPEAKRTIVQKYLAEKLGPPLSIPAEEVSRSFSAADRARVAALDGKIAALKARQEKLPRIQAAWEAWQGAPPVTHVLRRGNHVTPGAEVQPGVFSVLTDPTKLALFPAPAPGAKTSGRRTAWARWLTRPDHPLTARVFVNRVWQHHFGEGIVTTSDNFGHLGARPTHPELLDWLATEFVQSSWKIKALHRLIVTSTVYRQSSAQRPGAEQSDPSNQLLWRMRLRRLESEAVRDAVLTVSGRLDRTVGGAPVPLEPKADGMVVLATKGLPPTAQGRRSLYLFARRNYNLTLLGVFDQPVMATNCTRRIQSAVPLQSLTLLNDAILLEQADHFAARVASASDSAAKQVETAFRLAFGRSPTAKEVASGMAFLQKLRNRYAEEKISPAEAERKALARLCHMLMCANEFLYVG